MSDEYDVGYGKPPKRTRFKKGQSGNPKGRPPESERELSFEESFTDLLAKETVVVENGKRESITLMDALTRRVVTDAINGHPAAVRNAYNFLKQYGVGKRRAKQAREENSVTVKFVSGPASSLSPDAPKPDPSDKL